MNLTFRMLQHTSSEVTGITITKVINLNSKIKRDTGDELKINNKIDTSFRNY